MFQNPLVNPKKEQISVPQTHCQLLENKK